MYIGQRNKLCPDLKVHGTPMLEVSEDVYLGDIISADGKNTKNIRNRIAKGTGVICEIINILNTVTLGEHYFATAVLLRESLFLNSILTSAEIWYDFRKEEISDLENLNISLLRQRLLLWKHSI